jgi:hypothetical protein
LLFYWRFVLLKPPNFQILSCELPEITIPIINTYVELPQFSFLFFFKKMYFRNWPVGQYALQIELMGKLVHSESFLIKPSLV